MGRCAMRIASIALVVLTVLVQPSQPAAADDVEQRITEFWRRVDALAPSDVLTAADLGQWALNVVARDPGAGITIEDFRSATAEMQEAFERAGAGVPPGTPARAGIEADIESFWRKVDSLAAADLLTAADLGQWAINVTDRDPNKRIRVDDFRAATRVMQTHLDRARLLPRPVVASATPAPTPTPTQTPTATATPAAMPSPSQTPVPESTSRARHPAQELILPTTSFKGAVHQDAVYGSAGWSRIWRPELRDYYWVVVILDVRSSQAEAMARAQEWNCTATFEGRFTTRRIDPPEYDGGCVYEFAGDFVPYIEVVTVTRNVVVVARIEPARWVNETSHLADVANIADLQVERIDELERELYFDPPSELPAAVVGETYDSFSFCRPAPLTRTTPCGPGSADPTGGSPPYVFRVSPSGGSPPAGCVLLPNGYLSCGNGPAEGSEGRTYRFSVCAADSSGVEACAPVALEVLGLEPRTETVGGITFLARATRSGDVYTEATMTAADAESVYAVVQGDIEAIEREYRYKFAVRPEIYVYATTSSYTRGLETVVGMPRMKALESGSSTAGLFSPYGLDKVSVNWSEISEDRPIATVRHELSHLMFHQIARPAEGKEIPAWFNEGNAELIEQGVAGNGWYANRARYTAASMAKNGLAFALSAITDQEVWNRRAGLPANAQYWQAGEFVHALRDEVGSVGVVRILEMMGAGRQFDDALTAVTRMTISTFETVALLRTTALSATYPGIVTAQDESTGEQGLSYTVYGLVPNETFRLTIESGSIENRDRTRTANEYGVYSAQLGSEWPARTYEITVTQGEVTVSIRAAKASASLYADMRLVA